MQSSSQPLRFAEASKIWTFALAADGKKAVLFGGRRAHIAKSIISKLSFMNLIGCELISDDLLVGIAKHFIGLRLMVAANTLSPDGKLAFRRTLRMWPEQLIGIYLPRGKLNEI